MVQLSGHNCCFGNVYKMTLHLFKFIFCTIWHDFGKFTIYMIFKVFCYPVQNYKAFVFIFSSKYYIFPWCQFYKISCRAIIKKLPLFYFEASSRFVTLS